MTTEQAPGIPWHDHEWVEVTTLGAGERYFICAYGGLNTGCPAEKLEPIPDPRAEVIEEYARALGTILSAEAEEIRAAAEQIGTTYREASEELTRRLREAFAGTSP